MDKESYRIFLMGLAVLFGWMLVIVICASPQLFRNLFKRYVCCCYEDREEKKNKEKIQLATARMMTARRSIMTTTIAAKPAEIMMLHALGRAAIPPIPEESRAGTVVPEDNEDDEICVLRTPSIA